MKKAKKPRELTANALRWSCDPRSLGFRTTAQIGCCREIIGQPRAMRAIRLGLEFRSPGYNIFVAGLTGTGKTTAIKRLLEDLDLPGGPPPDLCYVHNFRRPDEPMALQLPAGKGRVLKRDVADLIDHVRRALAALFDSEPYKQARRELHSKFEGRIKALFADFESRVAAEGFQIVQVQMGSLVRADVFPTRDGKALPIQALREQASSDPVVAANLPEIERHLGGLQDELEGLMRQARELERELRTAVQELDRENGRRLVRGPVGDLADKYTAQPRVVQWLRQIQDSILETLPRFTHAAGSDGDGSTEGAEGRSFQAYDVNVFVDNSGVKRPPVVVEAAPTLRNLFGGVERVLDRTGVWRSDHTLIRAGSLHRANGGYLVFNLLDAAAEPPVWPTLKRVLKNMRADIPVWDPFLGIHGGTVKPEPVDLQLTVIVLGDNTHYQVLYDHDDEFRKVFKVKADFDSTTRRDRRAQQDYAAFIATLCQDESLLHFSADGVAAVIEAGVRLAGRQDKLSTRFSDIADIVREAHYWARKDSQKMVGAAQVDRAVRERVERVNLVEHKLQEAFETGQLLVDVRGRKIGQINALTVYDFGDHVFGRPARITSTVSMGRSGIINIEREANLSGATHDKGVLILAGYLRGMYAQDKPLTLSASVAFEQSYGGIEGDSATAAEVFVLLSAIANLPLRQDIAVTGSVDQKGQLQPVGGVSEKIEGFFDVCKVRGLSGSQGVVIPAQNAGDLMLRKDIVDAVRRKRFHVYPVRTVDEGLEVMTGLQAGRRRRHRFEAKTVHRAVDDALYQLAEGIKSFVDGADTPTGGPPPKAGLVDEDSEEGTELRRLRRTRSRLPHPIVPPRPRPRMASERRRSATTRVAARPAARTTRRAR